MQTCYCQLHILFAEILDRARERGGGGWGEGAGGGVPRQRPGQSAEEGYHNTRVAAAILR